MESQEKDMKTDDGGTECSASSWNQKAVGKEKNDGRKRSEIGLNSSESPYPSSSSYITAEEHPMEKRLQDLNGTPLIPEFSGLSVDELVARIRKLEDILADKEAALFALTQELDAVREVSCIDASIGPLSSGLNFDFKASLAECNRKLQEHASALCQRDEMIQKLAGSLKQSVHDREELKREAGRLTEQVHILQTQLQSVGKQIQQPQTKLLEALKEKDIQLQKKVTELSHCKAQSSKEVQFLMSSLEELQQRAVRSASASPPLPVRNDQTEEKLLKELRDLRLTHCNEMTCLQEQLIQARKSESVLREKLHAANNQCEELSIDVSSLKLAYEAQLSVCRDQHQMDASLVLHEDNKEQKSLREKYHDDEPKHNEDKNRIRALEQEVQSLKSQLLEENNICEKQGDKIQMLLSDVTKYAADMSTCHKAMEQYKKHINDMQAKFSKELAQKDESHHAEVMLLNKHLSELQEASSAQLNKYQRDLNEMKHKQMEDLGMVQLSHENELNTCKRDAERCRTDLRDKLNKMSLLEQQLDEEKRWSRTYSQQVQELGGKLSKEESKNEEYQRKVEFLENKLKEIDDACNLYQPQIKSLHQQLQDECQKSTILMKQLEDIRKELLKEQERCKSYCHMLDTSNTNLKEIQKENSEMKIQALKLNEQLKIESNRANSYKNDIHALNTQLKNYVLQEKTLQDVQSLLEKEKQLAAKYKSDVDTLKQLLKDQKIQYDQDCLKLHSLLQEKENLIEEQKQRLGQLEMESLLFKQQLNSSAEQVADQRESQDIKQEDALVDTYKEQIKSLESNIEKLSERNLNLKKEREEVEIELKSLKNLFFDSKEEFEKISLGLKNELAKKEEALLNLQNIHKETAIEKTEIQAYNQQIKELLSAKALLENELHKLRNDYCNEVGILKDQVAKLEEKLGTSMKTVNEDYLEILIRKCQEDVRFLHSMCLSNSLPTKDSTLNDVLGINSECSESLGSSKNGKHSSQSIPGLLSIEKILEICETSLKVANTESPSKVLADQLCKSQYTIEKLNLKLEAFLKETSTLRLEKEAIIAKNEELDNQVAHLKLKVDSLQNCASRNSEDSNMALESDGNGPLSTVSQSEALDSQSSVSTRKPLVDISEENDSCKSSFSEEKDSLQETIRHLKRELVDKDKHCGEKLQNLRRELEDKHKNQMEELRTYFEQKCADFEKHYSEEVFSQHSRKLSDCSSASESELVSEMYYAGPGSASGNGQGAHSHICDSLGESSFKDFEEHVRSVDLEKLFTDNREQIETMRLALESRHQGELEAQKELYEARVEELLRNMTESHVAELKLQSRHLQDMQEVENTLNKKLCQAENDISLLKNKLESCGQRTSDGMKIESKDNGGNKLLNSQCDELKAQLLYLTHTLKQKDSENSAQLATLKTKLRQNQEIMSKLEKDLSDLRSKYNMDTHSLKLSLKEKVELIKELEFKNQQLSCSLDESNGVKKKLELEIKAKCTNSVGECERRLQEKETEFKSIMSDMRAELIAQHEKEIQKTMIEHENILKEEMNRPVEERKARLEAEYAEYLEFVKKCADETKLQLVQRHESEIKQIAEKHQKEISELRDSQHIKLSTASGGLKEDKKEMFKTIIQNKISETSFTDSSLGSCLQALLKMSEELDFNQFEQLGSIIIELCEQITVQQEKYHQEEEMRLENVQRECERRFHLQLEEARTDIVQALEHHIQRLLDDNDGDVDKPVELQKLERKFTSKYEQKLTNMQKEHEAKISELCLKHAAQLSQARSKIHIQNNPIISTEEVNKLCKERDCLRNVAATLRDVVAELVHYFMSWEDEFNNTLMDELVKLEAAKDCDILSISQPEESSFTQQCENVTPRNSVCSDDEIPVIVATPARGRRPSSCLKRVHFAPDVSGILSLIGDESLLEGVGLNCSIRDASLNIQEELNRCLSRLRADSAALYALSQPALPSSSSKQEDTPLQIAENLVSSKSVNIEELCKENEALQKQLAVLREEQEKSQAELQALRLRLEALQHEANQQAEVVAEGYGEGDQSVNCDIPSSPRATSVEELQHKVHSLLLGVSCSEDVRGVISPNSSQHLPHIVEELCRDWERLAEESRHKQDDFQQQVEAADKQLRAMRTFMDEQASEREQERDDFVQEINRLQELLRDKDRDRNSQQQISHEVEALEGQLKETQSLYQDTREKLESLNAEHKQAVEKIWTLRDIISDLEIQVAAKAEEAASVAAQNEALQQLLEQQGRTQLELAQEMEELQCSSNGKLMEQIARLEEQLRKHQVFAEQFGDPAAIDQMKCQLYDLGVSLEVQTKELECANASTTLPASPCLSSPSEDVSIRETLEAIRAAADEKQASQLVAPPLSLPFNEVSRVLEKWQRHARADDAVLKKIRDLDMQLEDIQVEKSTLSSRLQEQMLLSSSLQTKLDEHRRKADVKLSKATAEMQSQIEDLKSEIDTHVENLESRERQIETLKSSLHRAETELRRRDTEVRKSTEAEQNMAAQLKYQVSKLSADKEKLQAMLSEKDAMHASLPALVESMLEEKNADIDRLERLNHQLANQMELSSQYVATPSTTLEFEYCESEKIRARIELSPVLELRSSVNMVLIDESNYTRGSIHPNDSSLLPTAHKMSLEHGGIELSDKLNDVSLVPISMEESLTQSQENSNNNNDSTESTSDTVSSSTGTSNTLSLSDCEKRLTALQQELALKNKTLEDYKEQLSDKFVTISDLEKRLAAKQTSSDSINDATKFEMDLKTKDVEIQQLRKELLASQGKVADTQTKSQQHTTSPDQSSQSSEMQLQAKDTEIQRLRDEVCATQAILSNLQRKVQEAKQIARSPSRSSPEKSQATRAVHNELEAAKTEIVELKNLCDSIRSNVEKEYQQKQAEFEVMLGREQESKKSLIETLNKVQEENKRLISKSEEQLEKAERELKERGNQVEKLQTEIDQLNMECVTLKHQMSTPISEATALATKLDAEKKFALALKEELLLHKRRASSLDEQCLTLKDRVLDLERMCDLQNKSGPTPEEVQAFLKEISELKTTVNKLLREQSRCQKHIENLMHENTLLREENSEVCKELSDMKRVIIGMHGKETSRDDIQKILQSKIDELNKINIQSNNVYKELSSLRNALININTLTDLSDLKEGDRIVVRKLQKQLQLQNLKGAGDGPWNRLSVSETDVHEILPDKYQLTESESLDDLTGAVQHELDLSVQLDQTLLKTLDPLSSKKQFQSRSEGAELKSNENIGKSGRIGRQTFRSGEKEAQDKIHLLEVQVGKLHQQLETERAQYFTLQQQDCDLIEEMRIKLSDALDGQDALRLQLQSQMNKHQTFLGDERNTHESPRLCSPSNEIIVKLQEQLNDSLLELQKLRVQKDAAEKQLRRLQEVEIQRSRRRAVTEEKHRRRIDQLQSLQTESQQECLMLRQELKTVNQKLQLAHEELARDRDAQLKNHTPFVERLKNMNTFLEEHIEENVRMAKQMEDLTEEHQKLRRKIAQLEHLLAEKRNNESFVAANARFAAERAEWETEQNLLLLALNEAKQKQMLSPESEVEDRISHLFGRYLRMQSYRKALVWQKRYLLSVIMGMNESKILTTVHLASVAGNLKPTADKHNALRQKFRSAVMVLMAIHRMQFLVERWQRGKRVGYGVVLQQTLSQYTLHEDQHSNFPANLASAPSEEMRSGLSLSPPTLERPRQPRIQHSGSLQFSRLAQNNRGYRPANSLSECVTNFHLVQQRFDALLSNPPK